MSICAALYTLQHYRGEIREDECLCFTHGVTCLVATLVVLFSLLLPVCLVDSIVGVHEVAVLVCCWGFVLVDLRAFAGELTRMLIGWVRVFVVLRGFW
jgi:hypothetical protein